MFLGIDESNHGRIPEIFVGVFSTLGKDIRKSNFEKNRDKRSFPNLNDNQFYKHIIFDETSKKIATEKLPIIATLEFLKYYSKFNPEVPLSRIYLDGEALPNQKELLEKNLPYNIKVNWEPRSDIKYGIVNFADIIANRLYRYYSIPSKKPKLKYSQTLITPKLEDYLELL